MIHQTLEKIQAVIELLNNGNIVISDCTGLKCEETIKNALEQAEKIAKGEWYIAVNIGEPFDPETHNNIINAGDYEAGDTIYHLNPKANPNLYKKQNPVVPLREVLELLEKIERDYQVSLIGVTTSNKNTE
jgi:hypothetical protein